MKTVLPCWNPRRWYAELRHVWQDTRLLVLSAQIAAIYAAVLIPFKVGIPIIPGFVELRPANVIPVVSGLLFGPAAAWGSGLGNVIGDCFGTLGPASLFGFLGNFLYGYVPYLLWGNLGWVSSGREPVVRSWRQGVEYGIVCVVASLVCAVTIGWGVEVLGLLPFWLLSPAIFLNNLVMATLLGPPLLLFLYPRVKQWNLYYRDLAFVGAADAQRNSVDARLPSGSAASRQSTQSGTIVVSIQDLTFCPVHAEQPVLTRVSLDVRRGEVVVLMGRAGSGKSSLCYALNGLIPQFIQGEFVGTVLVDGQRTTQSPVWKQANCVGMVFQDFETQLVSTNVEAELRCALEAQGGTQHFADEASFLEHVRRLLDLVGLSGLERRDPFSLSGGQRQRLVVASVLVREPQVIVMDQPLTDLDPEGRRQFFLLLEQLKAKGLTIIMAGHGIEDVLKADRVCVLDDGALVWQGPPREILRQPDLAERYGVPPYPLAACFRRQGQQSLPTSVEEAWQLAETLGLTLVAPPVPEDSGVVRSDSSAPVLELRNVSAQYQHGVPAISRVSVSFQAGEFTALLGQNGSGKSTLAKLCNGLLLPSEGRVLVLGRDTQRAGVGRLSSMVGYVFQNPDHQIFAETVRKEVAFGARNAGCSPDECAARVTDALQAVGLTGAEERDPFSLTKGERQRVAVASILAARPGILIVDEPTTGLDAEESVRMMNMMRLLHQRGHTIIVITHDMEIVANYATRCVLMRRGRILADGPTREIFSDPDLLRSAALTLPSLTRFAQRWGMTLLTVDEVRKAWRVP